jgi:tight adherence protein C
MSILLKLTALGLLVFGVYRFVNLMFPDEEEEEAKKQLGVAGVHSEEPSLVLRVLRPLFPLFSPMMGAFKLERYRNYVRRGFITAGMAGEITPDEYFSWKLLMAIMFPGTVLLALRHLWQPPWYALLFLFLLGFFYPDIWLDGRVKERQKKILRMLPYTMDMLTLSVEAGMDFVAGIGKVVEKSRPGPLRDELNYYLHEIQVGTTRAQAMRNLAWRCNMTQLSSFSALLVQADQLGASIGPVLRAQSELLRVQRFAKAEEMGAAASVKILFPLIFCIMPAVFIVIFGPILLNFIYGDGTVGDGQT